MLKFIAMFGPYNDGNGPFDRPWFLTTDKQGNIYVIGCFDDRIQIFDSNGYAGKLVKSNRSINDQFNTLMQIALISEEDMFINSFNNYIIVQLNEKIQFIQAFGSKSKVNGQLYCNRINVLNTNDNIVMVDTYND